MNAKQIRKLRKKISKNGYYERRRDMYAKKCDQWNCQKDEKNLFVFDPEEVRNLMKLNYYLKKVGDNINIYSFINLKSILMMLLSIISLIFAILSIVSKK